MLHLTTEQQLQRLIDRVWGNLAIEKPTVTREFVAEQLTIRAATTTTAVDREPVSKSLQVDPITAVDRAGPGG